MMRPIQISTTMNKDEYIEHLKAVLIQTRAIVVEGAVTGFNYKDGDWAGRLFDNNGAITQALQVEVSDNTPD